MKRQKLIHTPKKKKRTDNLKSNLKNKEKKKPYEQNQIRTDYKRATICQFLWEW